MKMSAILLLAFASISLATADEEQTLLKEVTHAFAENDGVKIHYVSIGEGTPIVMIHGFPDFWYSWRHQMMPLSKAGFKVIALDLRGYNKSDKPRGVDQYAMPLLVGDVAAVVKHAGAKKAVICGHDWGGAVAWAFAMMKPELTERLMILNSPHPHGITRELARNSKQARNSAYARKFQEPDAHKALTAEGLAGLFKDEGARRHYLDAFKRSDFEAMLNYYKKNYPRPPYKKPTGAPPKVSCPVLMIHGLDDPYLLAPALNDSWDWLEKDLTLVTVPKVGHFVHHDAPEFVTKTMLMWLQR